MKNEDRRFFSKKPLFVWGLFYFLRGRPPSAPYILSTPALHAVLGSSFIPCTLGVLHHSFGWSSLYLASSSLEPNYIRHSIFLPLSIGSRLPEALHNLLHWIPKARFVLARYFWKPAFVQPFFKKEITLRWMGKGHPKRILWIGPNDGKLPSLSFSLWTGSKIFGISTQEETTYTNRYLHHRFWFIILIINLCIRSVTNFWTTQI